jgi:hypothetical protein
LKVGLWRIVVDSYRVRDDVAVAPPSEGSRWLLASLTVTNLDERPQRFFLPDQLTLVYLTEPSEPRRLGCASGFCERSAEFGGDDPRHQRWPHRPLARGLPGSG